MNGLITIQINITPPQEFQDKPLHKNYGLLRWLWLALLTAMTLCGNIADTFDFAQLAGHGVVSFWRLMGM